MPITDVSLQEVINRAIDHPNFMDDLISASDPVAVLTQHGLRITDPHELQQFVNFFTNKPVATELWRAIKDYRHHPRGIGGGRPWDVLPWSSKNIFD
jgi:hypothetical protein